MANLDKPKPGYMKSLDNILFGFGLSRLGKCRGALIFISKDINAIPDDIWLLKSGSMILPVNRVPYNGSTS